MQQNEGQKSSILRVKKTTKSLRLSLLWLNRFRRKHRKIGHFYIPKNQPSSNGQYNTPPASAGLNIDLHWTDINRRKPLFYTLKTIIFDSEIP